MREEQPSLPQAKEIEKLISQRKNWELGDSILYRLCKEYPDHRQPEVVIAKIWLIGRAYSAAIERRTNNLEFTGDSFYEEVVVPKFSSRPVDNWFTSLAQDKTNDDQLTLVIHKNLTLLFEDISGLEKRSLASKYLHFHFPERYFIYDSLAHKAVAALNTDRPKIPTGLTCDKTYAQFFYRCKELKHQMEKRLSRKLTNREVDKFLLERSKPAKKNLRR